MPKKERQTVIKKVWVLLQSQQPLELLLELDLGRVQESLHPAFYVGGVRSIHDVDPDIEEKAQQRLDEMAGITTTYIPFGGTSPAVTALLASQLLPGMWFVILGGIAGGLTGALRDGR